MGKPEPIVLQAQDGVHIAGAYVNADQPRAAAVLLHMMPATKESWSAFASRLSGLGIASLAIDLRGHGASNHGPSGALDYRLFTEVEHRAKRLDVEAALDWLRSRHPDAPLLAVGASIGANLALRAMADHDDVAAVLALSPGLDYRGVSTEDAALRFRNGQRALLAASREDEYSTVSIERLGTMATEAKIETVVLDDAGHGTVMLERDAVFADRAAAWLEAAL